MDADEAGLAATSDLTAARTDASVYVALGMGTVVAIYTSTTKGYWIVGGLRLEDRAS